MRLLWLTLVATLTFWAVLFVDVRDADAVVCARGARHAGCATAGGAAVVRRPAAAACRYVVVDGVRVRRCV